MRWRRGAVGVWRGGGRLAGAGLPSGADRPSHSPQPAEPTRAQRMGAAADSDRSADRVVDHVRRLLGKHVSGVANAYMLLRIGCRSAGWAEIQLRWPLAWWSTQRLPSTPELRFGHLRASGSASRTPAPLV